MRIDICTAQKLIKNYTKYHWATINQYCPSLLNSGQQPPVQDSRSVWFSFEELQGFISAAQNANLSANGIRFYFGEYSEDIIKSEINTLNNFVNGTITPADAGVDTDINTLNQRIANLQQYTPGMQTLVMIPTVSDPATNLNCDFNIAQPQGSDISDFSDITAMAAENHGGMVPPPYDDAGLSNDSYGPVCGAYFMDVADGVQ